MTALALAPSTVSLNSQLFLPVAKIRTREPSSFDLTDGVANLLKISAFLPWEI